MTVCVNGTGSDRSCVLSPVTTAIDPNRESLLSVQMGSRAVATRGPDLNGTPAFETEPTVPEAKPGSDTEQQARD